MPVTMRRVAGRHGFDHNLVYLLMLAGKYGLEPTELYNALQKAKGGKESSCGPLSIELRESRDNTFCFMFSQNDRSVAQAAVTGASLERLRNVPPELKQLLHNPHSQSNADKQTESERRITDLQYGLKHVNLKARVTQKSEVRAVESRNGSPLAVCMITLSDGTGEIRLPLWNQQIDTIAKNDTVVVKDATIKNFRGEMQLSLPRKTGTILIVQ